MKAAAVFALLLLISGAASAQDKPEWMQYKNQYVGETSDVATPHRTAEEVARWAEAAAADVLSFGRDNYKARFSGFKRYFIAAGWGPYADYIRAARLIEAAQTGQTVGAVISRPPDIATQGVGDGAYHWVVTMPVIVSLIDPRKAGPSSTAIGHYTATVDVVRTGDTAGEGLAIAGWRMDGAP